MSAVAEEMDTTLNSQAAMDASAAHKKNKLGYNRISVACGQYRFPRRQHHLEFLMAHFICPEAVCHASNKTTSDIVPTKLMHIHSILPAPEDPVFSSRR
jgi:hypothetical protein